MHSTSGKIITSLTAALLGLSTVGAVIIAQAKDNTQFNGVYMGLSAGGLNTAMDLESLSTYNFNQSSYSPESVTSDSYQEANDTSTVWAGRLGYGTNIYDSIAWLGLEIFGNLANREVENDSFKIHPSLVEVMSDTQASLNNGEYGIDLKPGVLLGSSSLLYARIGAAFNILRVNSEVFGDNNPYHYHTYLPLNLNLQESKHVTGLRLGLGFEQKVSCQLSFALDYIYTTYGSISNSGSGYNVYEEFNNNGRTSPHAYASLNTSNEAENVKTNAVMLGVNYYPMVNDCKQ